jgi:iron complex outermembrane recepter protein
MHKRMLLAALLAGSWLPASQAQQTPKHLRDLSAMTIEALMNLQVTSVSRKPEPLSRAAAAVYVITRDDIRRSTATSIPELLRMVPGLEVAQMDASTWAISARGFNTQYASYMLVLVDGRVVFDPSFNGVYWSVQDTLLEDIDRIEVICGPGAALWGQNAVNGVISITTTRASESQGGLLTVVAGNQETPDVGMRYGGKAGAKGHYRVFSKYSDRQEEDLSSGLPAGDGWHSLRTGFRSDWDLSDRDSLVVQGDGYRSLERHRQNQIVSILPPVQQEVINRLEIAGGDAMVHWHRTISDHSDLTLYGYYDYTYRRDQVHAELRHTGDIDFQHHIAFGGRHDLLWGVGWRHSADYTSGSLVLSFNPRVDTTTIWSAFAQDQVALWPDRLYFMLGARLSGDEEGTDVLPDARVLWTPRQHHAFWLAVSRTIGDRSFASRAVRSWQSVSPGPAGVPIVATVLGGFGSADSHALSLQSGYRAELGNKISVSAAGFYTRHDHAPLGSPGALYLESDPAPAHLIAPILLQNSFNAETRGLELSWTWQVNSRWRLSAADSLLFVNPHAVKSVANLSFSEGSNPQNQFQARSYLNLPRSWEWDLAAYYVGNLPTDGIPAYLRCDTRVGWQASEHLSLSLVGQNLLQPRHAEFGSSASNIFANQIRRSGYAKLTWSF